MLPYVFQAACVPMLAFVDLAGYLTLPVLQGGFVVKTFLLVRCPVVSFGYSVLALVSSECSSVVYIHVLQL
jgi:hypothetical protein